MTNSELSYCKVCENRKIKYPLGMVCNITQQKPKFEKGCLNYKLDKAEYMLLKNDKIAYYKGLNDKGNSFGRKINSNTISYEQTHISEKSNLKLTSKPPSVFEIKSSIHYYIYTCIIPSILCIIIFIHSIFSRTYNTQLTVFAVGFITLSVSMVIYGLIKINDNKPKIILNNKGIELEGRELINWQDVLMTQIKRQQGKYIYEYLIISQISTIKDKEFNISKLDILGWQLGHYIELYKKKYQNI